MRKNEAFNCLLDLIDNGLNVKEKEALYHQTPHHYAYSNDRLHIVEYFIEKGTYIESKAQYQRTSLHNAYSICILYRQKYNILYQCSVFFQALNS